MLRVPRVRFVLGILLLGAFCAHQPALAARAFGASGSHPWCATDASGLDQAQARHRRSQRRFEHQRLEASRRGEIAPVAAPTVRKAGHVAVIDDDGTLISTSNTLDLEGRAVRFQRRGDEMLVVDRGVGVVNGDFGTRIDIGDDASVEIPLDFSFSFFGQSHQSVFLNSDGNLTFEEAEFASSARSVARMLNGPPRIAPFFADLDASVVSGSEGVFVRNTSTSLQVTWVGVPEFDTTNSNTFQVTLRSNGHILVTFGDLDAEEGVVGVAPGGGGPLDFLDLTTELPFGPTGIAVLERFTTSTEVDDFAVAAAFFDTFRDVYDHLIVFEAFSLSLGDGFAFELTLKNDIEGIGVDTFDFSDLAGSDSRLESYLQMGPLEQFPTDPKEQFLGTNNTLDILGQEAGHRWLAFVDFEAGNGFRSRELLGRDFAHWSFFKDSDASVMEGNAIQDNGDGTFVTVAATERYSQLDQYLMGLIPPEAVAPFFYVIEDGTSGLQPDTSPILSRRFSGSRVDVTVDDVIAVEGIRVPASADARRNFNMAFIVLGREGQPVTKADIARVNKIRKQWILYWRGATDKRSKVKTAVRKSRRK